MGTNLGDVRPFIKKFEEIDELRNIKGANWNLEIDALSGAYAAASSPPTLLFDSVNDCSNRYRVLTNIHNTQRQTTTSLELDQESGGVELVDAYRNKLRTVKPVPPKKVSGGPIFGSIQTGDQMDLLRVPPVAYVL